jgi:hypothetical protein
MIMGPTSAPKMSSILFAGLIALVGLGNASVAEAGSRDAIVAGVAGFIAGAIIAGQAAQARTYPYDYRHSTRVTVRRPRHQAPPRNARHPVSVADPFASVMPNVTTEVSSHR